MELKTLNRVSEQSNIQVSCRMNKYKIGRGFVRTGSLINQEIFPDMSLSFI